MTPATTIDESFSNRFRVQPIPQIRPLSVIIPYHRNQTGLAVTLATLQAQIVPPKAIVVIDTSRNKSGLEIARRYATHGQVPVVVEVAPRVDIYEAWNKGLSIVGEEDTLIINDDLLMPLNFVDVLSFSRSVVPALAYAPVTPPREHSRPDVDVNFAWWNEVPGRPEDFSLVDWLPGFCFMLSKEALSLVGGFDDGFKVWFGDDDYQERLKRMAKRANLPAIVRINTLYAYHYGGRSYQYQTKTVKAKIDKDRAYFRSKYGDKAADH